MEEKTKASRAVSPTLAQYREVKAAYPGAAVLYQIGSFYEFFEEDALKMSQVLGLKLAAQNKKTGQSRSVPMCGVPIRSLDRCVERLQELGYTVILCDQTRGADGKVLPRRNLRMAQPSTEPMEVITEGDSLELEKSVSLGTRRRSLVSSMDATLTPLGKKLLLSWMRSPLTDQDAIAARGRGVELAAKNNRMREKLRDTVKKAGGVEKRLGALRTRRGKWADIRALGDALRAVNVLKRRLERTGSPVFCRLAAEMEGGRALAQAVRKEREESAFPALREKVLEAGETLERIASAVAETDVLLSLAETGEDRGYSCPRMTHWPVTELHYTRNPLKELYDKETYSYRGVDWALEGGHPVVVTGPEQSGKTTHLRALALTAIMAQVGGMVSVDHAPRMGVTDKLIYLERPSLAQVEEALAQSTRHSLVLLDEAADPAGTVERLAQGVTGRVVFATEDRPAGALAFRLGLICRKMRVTVDKLGPLFYHDMEDGYFDMDIEAEWERVKKLPRKVWR